MTVFETILVIYGAGLTAGFVTGLMYIHHDADIRDQLNWQNFTRPAALGLLTALSWLSPCIALYDYFNRNKRT